jgi:hypothetical protein
MHTASAFFPVTKSHFPEIETAAAVVGAGPKHSAGVAYSSPSTFAAIASISTLNSGRVKPETIISVEAGGGSAA